MPQRDPSLIFDKNFAEKYDEQYEKMNAITDHMYFLIELILQDLPENARILCVGAGTGKEIIYLAERFPNWQFVAVEPSQSMLAVCQSKLEKYGFDKKCETVHGYVCN